MPHTAAARRAIDLHRLTTFLVIVIVSIGAASAQTVSEQIDDGTVQFWADAAAKASAEPSYAMQHPFPSLGPPPPTFPLQPTFTMSPGYSAVIPIPSGTSLYGTGEVFGDLLRNGQTHAGQLTRAWNTDAYGYGDWSPSLYKSHPWVLGVRPDGTAFGVLADTTYSCWQLSLHGRYPCSFEQTFDK